MKKALYMLVAFAVPVLADASLARADGAVRVQMGADRTDASLTDNIVVQISVQVQSNEEPRIEVPQFEGFQIVQRGMQRPMSFSIGFGQAAPTVTSATNYTFVLQPAAAGRFQIPPARATLGGRTYASQPLTITVHAGAGQQAQAAQPAQPGQDPNAQNQAATQSQAQAPAPQAGSDVYALDPEAFLRTVVDKTEPYQGEQVTTTLYLYTRHNLQSMPAVRAEPSTDGFWIHDLLSGNPPPEPGRVLVKGRAYWVYVLRRFAAFPLRSGDLTIGAMSLTISHDSIFDMLDPSRAQPDVERTGVPLLLHVKPLPDQGKPGDGSNVVVGKLELRGALDRAQAATGDAVTLTATIKGTGNVAGIKLADPVVPGVDVLQPETHDLVDTHDDLVEGTRTLAWLMVPRNAGTFTIPALALDTFDPTTGQYKHLTSTPITLTAVGNAKVSADAPAVAATDHTSTSAPADTATKEEAWPPLHARSALARKTPAQADSPLYALSLLLAPLLWLGSVLVPVVRRRVQSRTGSEERKRLRAAQQRLQNAEGALGSNDGPRFHGELAGALVQLVAARLGDNIAGMTRNETRGVLLGRGVSDDKVSELLELLDRCDTARFSPTGNDPNEMKRLLARGEALFTALPAPATDSPGSSS